MPGDAKDKPCERCDGTGIEPWVPVAMVIVPVLTVSEANKQGDTQGKLARKKYQREMTTAHLWRMLGRSGGPSLLAIHGRLHVVMTRVAGRKMDDDNLSIACKRVRDSVAKWLGCDDGDEEKVTWQTKQIVRQGAMQVIVTFHRRRDACTTPSGPSK